MGLFNSLYTGASGILAQARSTQVIAENIANVSTNGYKRNDIAFNDLLGSSNRFSNTQSGGVSTNTVQRISAQGALQQSTSTTDLSIAGNGFFIVNQSTDDPSDLAFTRSGQFTEDASGFLRNTAGFALYGYLTDTEGNTIGDGEDSLVPIDLTIFETQFFETGTVDAAINLDAQEDRINPQNAIPAQQLPIDNLAVSFGRNLSVYDDVGQEQIISFEFRRTIGPHAHFSTSTPQDLERDDVLVDNLNGATPGINSGDQFQVSDGTNTLVIDFVNTSPADTSINEVQTVADFLDVVNGFTNGAGEALFDASITNENNQLIIQSLDPSGTLDITANAANVLGVQGLNITQDADAVPDYIFEPDYDINAAGPTSTYPSQEDFPDFENTTDPNFSNWWELTVVGQDPLGNSVNITQGLLNFNGDGSLNFVDDANGEQFLNLSADDLPFDSTEGIAVDITRITQFSGAFQTLELEQNGAPVGNRNGVEIDADGTVNIQFTNDLSLPVYKIPLAVFNNPDGLERIDGTAFRIPVDGASGELNIQDSLTGGAGSINGSSLEASNVDLTDEFGYLIVAQRAYGLNSQVLQAANEMTQGLAQLKS